MESTINQLYSLLNSLETEKREENMCKKRKSKRGTLKKIKLIALYMKRSLKNLLKTISTEDFNKIAEKTRSLLEY